MGLRRRKQNDQSTEGIKQKKEDRILHSKNTIFGDTFLGFEESFGFSLRSLTSLEKFTKLLYRPCDGSSLAVIRMMFGIVMLVDTMEERGFSNAEKLWGDPNECRFPLLHFLRPLPLKWMCLLYIVMCIGAIGITFGMYFRESCLALVIPYWYIFLLDKTAWNNHSYLFGLLTILITFSSANNVWSLDKLLRKIKTEDTIPMWNYAILRYQVFALYFFAGLKKIDFDWLHGYPMINLSEHWVFYPFKFFLSDDKVDLWIVHIAGFLLDFTAGFLIFFDSTRKFAFLFLTLFHLMNSRLFHIGMFPFMCLVTMPIFCSMDWPRKIISFVKHLKLFKIFIKDNKNNQGINIKNCMEEKLEKITHKNKNHVNWKKKLTSIGFLFYILLQCFLPYSHFVTKGYNNWTNGLYGYSWDMMVHTWSRDRIIIKIVDKSTNVEYFLNNKAWVKTDKWATHADMLIQYAQCIRENIKEYKPSLNNVSIHIDVWCSLNKRMKQRMFDPKIDLLVATWTPFQKVEWLMPLLINLTHWREKILTIQNEVLLWSNYSDVHFYADFPGLTMENYILKDLRNVTLTVLEGTVIMESDRNHNKSLTTGESTPLTVDAFHKIHTVSSKPSCFMYTFFNKTEAKMSENENLEKDENTLNVFQLLTKDMKKRLRNIIKIKSVLFKVFLSNFLTNF